MVTGYSYSGNLLVAKICHITSAHPRYDIRIFIKECLTLSKANHQVSLIVADDKPDELKSGVQIYSVGKPKSRIDRMLNTPHKIYQKILALQPDFVHFHDPELMLMCRKLRKHGIKVIYDVHEDLPKQVMSKHWLPKFIRPLVSLIVPGLEKYSSKKFYGIVAATPIIARRFVTYNPNTITVCNYPILSELNIVDALWESRSDKLCYIGSISPTRGIMPIIESLSKSNLTLELAGAFSGDISLDKLIDNPGGQYINYLGIINREQIVSLLKRVKVGLVTLLPTPSYIESLPIKMFEYMLAGIPVIASDFPLWRDIIDKYQCGVLVNPHDSQSIAIACSELINNPQKAQQMGENGKNAVLQEFNWEYESVKLTSFYSSR
jgi:glycosyltransferase involved in cell wall biosynthesis